MLYRMIYGVHNPEAVFHLSQDRIEEVEFEADTDEDAKTEAGRQIDDHNKNPNREYKMLILWRIIQIEIKELIAP